jgi:hypothetical protein
MSKVTEFMTLLILFQCWDFFPVLCKLWLNLVSMRFPRVDITHIISAYNTTTFMP